MPTPRRFEVAQANLDYAKVDLHRKLQLSAAQIISRSELDLAEKSFAVAEQQRDQAKATLADSTTQLGFTQIVAPISGVVSTVTTQEGETVAASFAAPTFVTLLDLSKLEVWAYVDETDIGHIRIGQQARFTVDTYGDHEFRGTVTSIHPKAEIRDNVVDYVVVVRFSPPHGFVLRPGDDYHGHRRSRATCQCAGAADSCGAPRRQPRLCLMPQ